ncbi:MinD/ParA family ATP-binding protein [Paraburkholderia terrae]|uniref:MinD/ParA family protein n=1 Tax=Paraburkholderia terrae TaxID=311230 RepID=UPI00296AA3A7|nr:MinD/ParA family protein [Paraburkholderia terrae]MDW3661898.1 MinD/ParA family protein [Paraburkholderia terrae]
MKDCSTSQALALRQLLANSAARVVAITAGSKGMGRTAAVVNLAMALTGQGMNVLVLDECPDDRSASAALGAARGAGAFATGVHRRWPRVLAVDALPLSFNLMPERGPDIVLVDAALDDKGGLSPLALQADRVVVVMRMSADAVASTYACMKRLRVIHGIMEFHVIANLIDGGADAHAVLESLENIARDYLAVSVHLAGCIASDPCVGRAAELSRYVVDAFPSSSAASDFARVAARIHSWPRHPVRGACL